MGRPGAIEGNAGMKNSIGIILATLALIGSAVAQGSGTIANPRGSIENFDTGTLLPILLEMGLQAELRQTNQGPSFISANHPASNLNFNVIPAACQTNGVADCVGLTTLALFSGRSVNAQTVMAFNERYYFTTAGKPSTGDGAFILRYDIADYGIPRGNVAASIGNFLSLALNFNNEIANSSQTANQIGYSDDLSAKFLNNRSLTEMSGEAPVTNSPIKAHQISFEETPEIVLQMLREDSAVHNKIENIATE